MITLAHCAYQAPLYCYLKTVSLQLRFYLFIVQ